MLPLSRQLIDTADLNPDRIAIESVGTNTSYGDLALMARQFASLISAQGISVGDRVLLCVENSIEYVVALYGCWIAGAIACPVNANARVREIVRVLDHAGASLLVADANNRQVRSYSGELQIPLLMIPRGNVRVSAGSLSWTVVKDQLPLAQVPLQMTSGAVILYTSGTTGNPKGVLLTHANLRANTDAIVEYLGIQESDRALAVLPFHYSYGNSVLLTHLAAAATIVIGPSMIYPQEVVNKVRESQITSLSGVPSMFAILLEKTDWSKNHGSLRYVAQAGGAMGIDLTKQLRAALGNKIALYIMYGQTEATARLSYLPPKYTDQKAGSVGMPIPGVELTIRDDSGQAQETGKVGTVWARGPNIMAGYWRNEEATALAIRDGWLNTGDTGYFDADGFLFLKGRSSEMIKTGAHRVSPEEIEEVACEVPGIDDAAAVGMPDPLLGQVIHLYVVGKKSEDTCQNLARHCREQLSTHKVPQYVHWLNELPRTLSGKLQRHKLRKGIDKEGT